MAKKIRITLVRSPIGRRPSHRATVRSLGLRKIGQTVEKEVNPAIMGMVQTVSYMVSAEEVE